MVALLLDAGRAAKVGDLAKKYLWWPAIGNDGHSLPRQIAQIMNFGTYDDIRRLEKLVGSDVLASVMMLSQPGWFDDRSWDFWQGRLSQSGHGAIPGQRPRRNFAA